MGNPRRRRADGPPGTPPGSAPQLLAECQRWRAELEEELARFTGTTDPGRVVPEFLQPLLLLRLLEERGLPGLAGWEHRLTESRSPGRALATEVERLQDRYPWLRFLPSPAAHPANLASLLRVAQELAGWGRAAGARLPAALPGLIHEQACAARHARGIYYTPTPVVEYIVTRTLTGLAEARGELAQHASILDPACGAGVFLQAAGRWLEQHRRTSEPTLPPGDLRRRILEEQLYGMDLDPGAILVTRLTLLLWWLEGCTPEQLSHPAGQLRADWWHHLRVGDALQAHWPGRQFQAIVGNPPWIQSKFLTKEAKVRLAATFVTLNKQYDLANGFLELAVALLAPGGTCGMILPNRLPMNPDYAPLRRFLLDRVQLDELTDVGEGVFPGVQMPSLILRFTQQPPAPQGRLLVRTQLRSLAPEEGTARWVEQARFRDEPLSVFSIYQDEARLPELTRLAARGTPLRELAEHGRGVEIGRRSDLIRATPAPGCVPLLAGEDLDRYVIRRHRYLRLGVPGIQYKDSALYQGPKLLVRKTGTGIRAALDRTDSYVLQVIYVLRPRRAWPDLRYLLAVLNSALLARYYHAKFGEQDKQTFPHLRQAALLTLPIPLPDPAHPAEATAYARILEAVDLLQPLASPAEPAASPHRQLLEETIEAALGTILWPT